MVARSSSSVLEFLNLLANVVKRDEMGPRAANGEGSSAKGNMDFQSNEPDAAAHRSPLNSKLTTSSPSDPTTRSQDYDTLQESAPKMLWFLDEYVADIKPRLLTLDPNDRKVKRKARQLLMELLFSTIDAATDDINDAFLQRRRQGSHLSSTSSRSTNGKGGDMDEAMESVVGDMSDDEDDETDEDARKLKVLGQIVKAELEELAEAAKDGIEELV